MGGIKMKPIQINKHVKIGTMEYKVSLNVELTFWMSIKLRIAGIYNLLDAKEHKAKPKKTNIYHNTNRVDISNLKFTKSGQVVNNDSELKLAEKLEKDLLNKRGRRFK
jgi:hypothetical protein